MININRVNAMILRYLYNVKHSFDRLSDMFYWPAMDLLLWGLTGLYFIFNNPSSQILYVMIAGLIFWIILWRTQYEITTNLLSELWDRNIVNVFSSPLTLGEWIAGFMIFGLSKAIISFIFSAILAFILYKVSILVFGFYLFPLILNLVLSGWAGGFFVAGILIRFGVNYQTLAWVGIYLIAPFSVIYYPLSILPLWAQKISLFIPTSYIFEGVREILFTGVISYDKLVISFVLNIIYLTLALWFFVNMFNKSKKLGLGRLI